MGTCFIIQPFDRDRFDKRYKDTFKPAIEAAGLEPYRVDQDPAAAIPINEIEAGIRRAEVCLAEVTTDNPNVWFELGYAIATRKPVVIVCDEKRERFPFDIQHRNIIHYKSDSISDFSALADKITSSVKAVIERRQQIDDVADLSPVVATDGLSQHEMVALVTVAANNTLGTTDPASAWLVRSDMNRAGFTDIAVTLAVRGLIRKNLIKEATGVDDNGEEYLALAATEAGMSWLDHNQEKLVLRKEPEPVF